MGTTPQNDANVDPNEDENQDPNTDPENSDENGGDEDEEVSAEELVELARELKLSPEQIRGRLAASRKWEKRAKDNHEKAQKFDALQKGDLDDIPEKAKEAITAAESRANEAEKELELYKASTRHHLDEEDLDFLRQFPADEIDERAAAFAARLKRATPKAANSDAAGKRGDSVAGGENDPVKAIDEQIAAAQEKGDPRLLLTLKRQRREAVAQNKTSCV